MKSIAAKKRPSPRSPSTVDPASPLKTYQKSISFPVVFIAIFVGLLHAGDNSRGVSDLSGFAETLILDQGRKKPMDTYARNTLLHFSGKRSYQRKPAVQWLARVLFAPESSQKDKVFMVNNQEVIQAMGLSLESARRFSYKQLEPGLEKLRELAIKVSRIETKQRSKRPGPPHR